MQFHHQCKTGYDARQGHDLKHHARGEPRRTWSDWNQWIQWGDQALNPNRKSILGSNEEIKAWIQRGDQACCWWLKVLCRRGCLQTWKLINDNNSVLTIFPWIKNYLKVTNRDEFWKCWLSTSCCWEVATHINDYLDNHGKRTFRW